VYASVIAYTREGAGTLFNQLLGLIAGELVDELMLYSPDSYSDLTDRGVSDDEDMRVFETG
jgi:hypothetical protein